MAAKDGFRLVRSDYDERPEQPDAGTAWNRAVFSPRILTSILAVTAAAAIAFAIVVVGNPGTLFANATAFLAALSAPQAGTREEMPATQSTAGTEAIPPIASQAPTDKDIAAPLKTADQTQTDIRQEPTGALLSQFQAWAADQDARAEVRTVQPAQEETQAVPVQAQPVQEARAQPAQEAETRPVQEAQPAQNAQPEQNARAEVRPAQRHRPIHRIKNARADIRARQHHRIQVRREQDARVQVRPPRDVRPARDARAPEQPVQNARAPTFLESIGLSRE